MNGFRAALLWMMVAAGCSSGPSDEQLTLDLFNRIALLFVRYNSALDNQDPRGLEGWTTEIRRLVAAQHPRIVAGLASSDSVVRADAAFALGFSKERAAISPLVTAASDPAVEVRSNAIASLGMLAVEGVPTEPFEKALVDPEWRVRVAALFGLRPLVDEKNDRGLLGRIHEKVADPDVNVRNEATILLAKLRRPQSVEVLTGKAVRDVDPRVRGNAAVTLGVIGAPAMAANPFLVEMLRDEDSKVVDLARDALNRINE